jgi:hypothetical protein
MNAIATHLDDLLLVLRASAHLRPSADTAAHLRAQVACRLDPYRPDLSARIRALDEWHCEVLADFLAEAHVMAEALDALPPGPPAADDTRVG